MMSFVPSRRVGRGDRRFAALAFGAGALVCVIVVAITVFLSIHGASAFRSQGLHFFSNKGWNPDQPKPRFGIEALIFGTVVSSIVALVIATPIALGSALFLTELAPAWMGRLGGYLLDMLAAVPSVVYGLWAVFVLIPKMIPVQKGLDTALGWTVIFHNRTGGYGRTMFVAGVVLAIMILPIIAAIARELFRQVPNSHREAAMALGATRWETIRLAVLPFSRSGMVGASMLGLGRALGETIAVALVLSATFTVNPHITEPGGNTIAANIATQFGEALTMGRSALVASGLVLFALTLIVNLAARAVVYRSVRAVEARP
jgi:phosphate transport system permease protein